MNTVLVLLLVISVLALLIGLFRPTWVIRWGAKRTRLRVLLYYGPVFVLLFIIIGTLNTPASDPMSFDKAYATTESTAPTPTTANTPSTSSAPTTATTSTTSTSQPASNTDSTADFNFLNAVNDIAYNTFVEIGNVGDQITAVGKSQESKGEFADFMQTDVTLWDSYIKKITSNKPVDLFLLTTYQQTLDNLNSIKHSAEELSTAVTGNDPNQIIKCGNDLSVAASQLKQAYSQATSQMDKYGIKANWQF